MGLIINGNLVTDITLGDQQVLKIEDSQGNVLYESGHDYFCLTANQNGSYVYGSGRSGVSLECSTDKQNWTSWDWEVYTYMNAGDKLYLRGNNPNGLTTAMTSNVWEFRFSGSFAASGDLTTLISKDGGVTTLPDYCFRALFSGKTELTTAPHIKSVTRVNQWALAGIFDGCTNLTNSIDLRNVTFVGSYGCSSMYYGCSQLSTIYAPSITTWNTTNFTGWVTGLGSTGTMWKPSSLTIPTGSDGKPAGWTTQDYA